MDAFSTARLTCVFAHLRQELPGSINFEASAQQGNLPFFSLANLHTFTTSRMITPPIRIWYDSTVVRSLCKKRDLGMTTDKTLSFPCIVIRWSLCSSQCFRPHTVTGGRAPCARSFVQRRNASKRRSTYRFVSVVDTRPAFKTFQNAKRILFVFARCYSLWPFRFTLPRWWRGFFWQRISC